MRLRAERIKRSRPKILDRILPVYETDQTQYPNSIRVSFDDGTTAVYDQRVTMPNPLLIKNISIIRKWKGYTPPEVRDEKD